VVQKKYFFKVFTWLISTASVLYVAYTLITFESYEELTEVFSHAGIVQFAWLFYVLLLLPFNWLIEALKWQKVSAGLEKLPVSVAVKAVLAGAATGFITPNKTGDILGRIVYLHEANRKPAISLAAVNSLTQNIAILIAGIPMAILFLSDNIHSTGFSAGFLIPLFAGILLVFLLLLFFLPRIVALIKSEKLKIYFSGIGKYSKIDLLNISILSLLRFAVFNFQLYLLLHFFGVELSISEALISIPASYLFITFTPSLAVSEGLVRSSWAVIIIGQYSDNTAGIILAGIGLWLINVVVPVVAGNLLILSKK
jgi:hypothetical protein